MGKMLSMIVMMGVCGLAAATCRAEPQERLIFDDEKQEWISVEELATPLEGTPAEAQALMEQGQYRQAEKLLEPYLETTPIDEPGRADALYLYAEAAFSQGHYGVADERYHQVINEYPSTRPFALALRRELEIAKAWLAGQKKRVLKVLKLDATDEALDLLSMIEQLAGGYRIAEVALWTKADYFFQTGQFELAEIAYRRLAENYNSPRYQKAAMYGASASALAAFPGVLFDDSSLLDAQELYTRCLRKYPKDSRKRDVPVILDQITLRRAEKDYEIARFYRKIHQPKAAAYYYEFVLRNWPNTLYAQKAQAELDELNVKN